MKRIPPFRNRRDVLYLVHEEPTKKSENGIYIVKPKDNSYRAIWAVVWNVPLKLMSTSDGYTKEEVDKIISTIKDYQKENDKLLENIKLEISKLNSKKADRTELANVVAGLVPMGSAANLAELETKPKRNNDAYYVEDQLSPEGNAYIYRWDAGLNLWVNTKQVVLADDVNQKIQGVTDSVYPDLFVFKNHYLTFEGVLTQTPSNYHTTDFLPIVRHKQIHVTCSVSWNLVCGLCFYDTNYNKIYNAPASYDALTGPIDYIFDPENIPEGAVFMRCTQDQQTDRGLNTTARIWSGVDFGSMAAVINNIKQEQGSLYRILPSVLKSQFKGLSSLKVNNKNLFSIDDVFYGFVDGRAMHYSSIYPNHKCVAIECEPETTYTLSGLFLTPSKTIGVFNENFLECLQYAKNEDADNITIDGGDWSADKDITIVTASDAKYIVFNVANTYTPYYYLSEQIQLEKNTVSTNYIQGCRRYLGLASAKDIKDVQGDIDDLKDCVSNRELQQKVSFEKILIKSDGTKEGSTFRTNYYSVEPGQTINVQFTEQFSSPGFSVISAWSSEDTFVSSILDSPIFSPYPHSDFTFIVPSGVNKIGIARDNPVYKLNAINIQEYINSEKKSLKCLFIGNSVNQDAAACIPYLLKEMYGDSIDFEIAIAYIGSYTIKDYVEEVITGQKAVDIYSYANNTNTWTNNTSVHLENILLEHDWNLVSFQMYKTSTTTGREEDISLAPQLVDYIKSKVPAGCKIGLVTPATFKDMRSTYMTWQQTILTSCALDFMLDYGATKEFMIQSGFTEAALSDDDVHSNDGFPCIAIALTAIHLLAQIYKLEDKASTFKTYITESEWNALNIPGRNGQFTTATTEEWKKAVNFALNGYRVSCSSYKISNDSLRNLVI